jgi:DNA relaxase NicK
MNAQKTTIDWLGFRAKTEPKDILQALRPMYGDSSKLLNLKQLDHGALGFQQAAQICISDMPIGRMDYGGESQRGWVRASVTGRGCEWVNDWSAASCVEELPSSEIRRLDIALTTWEGQVTHERVVDAHTAGRFTVRRPPVLSQVTSSDSRAGRTCYIGKREKADKFMRCYEKGYEMLSKYKHMVRDSATHINGFRVEDIYRCEVELKAVNTDIPWEVIERRDQYFAGSYPFCADILPNIEADILQRRPQREPQTDLAIALENCRIQFGPTLFTALMCYQGDIMAVWDKVIGKHHNESLLEAGVLLVDHE